MLWRGSFAWFKVWLIGVTQLIPRVQMSKTQSMVTAGDQMSSRADLPQGSHHLLHMCPGGSKSLQVSQAGMQTGVERHEYPAGAGVGESYLSCASSPHSQSSHKGRSWCSPRSGKGSKPRTQGPSTQASPTSCQHSCARGLQRFGRIVQHGHSLPTTVFPRWSKQEVGYFLLLGWWESHPPSFPRDMLLRHSSVTFCPGLSVQQPQRRTKHKLSLQQAPCYIHSFFFFF